MAQVAFGDMALSVIDELPPGRLPISTRVLLDSAEHRDEVPAVVIKRMLPSYSGRKPMKV